MLKVFCRIVGYPLITVGGTLLGQSDDLFFGSILCFTFTLLGVLLVDYSHKPDYLISA